MRLRSSFPPWFDRLRPRDGSGLTPFASVIRLGGGFLDGAGDCEPGPICFESFPHEVDAHHIAVIARACAPFPHPGLHVRSRDPLRGGHSLSTPKWTVMAVWSLRAFAKTESPDGAAAMW